MTISATAVRFDEHMMWVDLTDGRTLGVPLAWFPRLLRASPEARARIAASMIGMKKQSDFPEPVPVVTAKLCRAMAFATACV